MLMPSDGHWIVTAFLVNAAHICIENIHQSGKFEAASPRWCSVTLGASDTKCSHAQVHKLCQNQLLGLYQSRWWHKVLQVSILPLLFIKHEKTCLISCSNWKSFWQKLSNQQIHLYGDNTFEFLPARQIYVITNENHHMVYTMIHLLHHPVSKGEGLCSIHLSRYMGRKICKFGCSSCQKKNPGRD